MTKLSHPYRRGVVGGFPTARAVRRAVHDNEPLMQFLAFGFTFDHETAQRSLEGREAARVAWLDEHGTADLHDVEVLALLDVVVREALAPHAGTPVTLGISGGFDSRPLAYTLWNEGRSPELFSFGSPGNIDFDLLQVLAGELSLTIHWINTNDEQWSLAEFDEDASLTNNLPLTPATIARQIMNRRHEHRIEPYGYPNGILTGGLRPPSKKYRGLNDVEVFAATNDPFGLQAHLPSRIVTGALRGHVASPERGFAIYRQLNLGYRQKQRIRPVSNESVTFVLPYDDPRWVGYWLSRNEVHLEHHKAWTRLLGRIESPLFRDLSGIEGEGWAFNRARLARIYGDDEQPGMVPPFEGDLARQRNPKNHFSVLACYRNNRSFTAMVDQSLERLADRDIFVPKFVAAVRRAFATGDSRAELALQGLVSTDIAAEAGHFD